MSDTPATDTRRSPPEPVLSDVVRSIELSPLGLDRYSAPAPTGSTGRLFGGLLVAQAVRAAALASKHDLDVHSCHVSFLRAGVPERPLTIDVERVHDGRSFVRRHVTGRQDGQNVFVAVVSLGARELESSRPEEAPIGVGPLPDELPTHPSALQDSAATTLFDLCPVTPPTDDGRPALHPLWIRPRRRGPDDLAVDAARIAFVSDFGLAKSVRWDTPEPSTLATTTLNHAVWFHRSASADQWLLLTCHRRWSGATRSLVDGEIRDVSGRLVASISQEVLARPAAPLRPVHQSTAGPTHNEAP